MWAGRAAWLILLLIVAFIPLRVEAQTQAQHDRLDELARFGIDAPMCERLGFTTVADFGNHADAAVAAEIATWGGDQQALRQASADAIARQMAIFETDLSYYSAHQRTEAELRAVRAVLERYVATCVRAASDPTFRALIAIGPNFDPRQAATAEADRLLSEGGLASWQTPLITARGDMMSLAGGCRHIIGPDRSDDLLTRFGRSDVPREREYYRRSFDSGIADPELTAFDEHQCARAIASYARRIASLTHSGQ